MIRSTTLALLLAALLAATGSAQDLPRVFATEKAPTESEFADPGAKERRAVMKDLLNQLRDKKKVFALVDTAQGADVIIELTDAGIGASSRRTARVNRLSGNIESSADKAYQAVATLRAGDYQTDLTGEGLYPVTVARQIAKDVEDWVKENSRQILGKRQP